MASTSKALLERVSSILKHGTSGNGFDKIMKKVNIISAVPGKLNLEMEVHPEHLNQVQILHGGMTSTLIDYSTTLALMATEDGTPGVSLNLSINFLKPAKVGETLKIEAEVLRKGRTVAYTTAKILNQKGQILALGNHVKHIGG